MRKNQPLNSEKLNYPPPLFLYIFKLGLLKISVTNPILLIKSIGRD